MSEGYSSAEKVKDVRFRTFALTLRPRNGVTDSQVETLTEWIRKRSEYYHVVTEKQGSARHVHAGIYLKKGVSRSNLVVIYQRLLKSFGLDYDERAVAIKGVHIMYNNDFVSSYLNKGDNTVVIATSLPEVGRLESWYPPKPAPKATSVERHSRYYYELEALWYKYTAPEFEVNTRNARDFLFSMMYAERTIAVIKDDRQIIQVARHLCRWLKELRYSTIELPCFEKEE